MTELLVTCDSPGPARGISAISASDPPIRAWSPPLGETAKLRTVSRAKSPQGVSASFRRFPPRRAVVEKAAISEGLELPALPALSARHLATASGCGTAGSPGTPARRHVPPPRAGCRRLRTIDGADHGGNPCAGCGGNHPTNLSESQAID